MHSSVARCAASWTGPTSAAPRTASIWPTALWNCQYMGAAAARSGSKRMVCGKFPCVFSISTAMAAAYVAPAQNARIALTRLPLALISSTHCFM